MTYLQQFQLKGRFIDPTYSIKLTDLIGYGGGVWTDAMKANNVWEWNWSNGEPVAMDAWMMGEPNGSGECVQLLRNTYFDDVVCSKKLEYVCEKFI